MIKIEYYRTEIGMLVAIEGVGWPKTRINGKTPEASFHQRWQIFRDEKVPAVVEVDQGERSVNERYELKNPTICGVPAVIPADDIEHDDDKWDKWIGKHAGLSELYSYKADKEPVGYKRVEFEVKWLGDLTFSKLGDPTTFKYKLHGEGIGGWREEESQTLSYDQHWKEYSWRETIHFDEVAKALVPDVAWHLQRSSISSKVAYRLVRYWVKQNIDPKYAEVTSDYDFCFTVKKKIRIPPVIERRKVGGSQRHPKFKNQTVETKSVDFFEMTHSPENYKGYTPIEGFTGDNLEELGRAIDAYLKELMEQINAPLMECPTCKGVGVVDFRKLPTNERRAIGPA